MGALPAMLLCLIMTTAVAALPAEPPKKLPCEPSMACALQMARDAAQKQLLRSSDPKVRHNALGVIGWSALEDTTLDPATLRATFTGYRARIDKMSPAEQVTAKSELARTMAAAGLIDEARQLAKPLKPADRVSVESSVARYYATRGRVREAFEAVRAIDDNSRARAIARSGVLNAVVDSGKPELLQEAAKHLDVQEPGLYETLLPLTLQAAGKHDEARAAALKIADAKSRLAALGLMQDRYYNHGPEGQSLPTQRLLEAEFVALKPETIPGIDLDEARADLREKIVESLIWKNQDAEALALIPKLPALERQRALGKIASKLETPADVRVAATLVAAQPEDEREMAEDGLLISRVRVGEITPAEAMRKSVNSSTVGEALIDIARDYGPGHDAEVRALLKAAADDAGDFGGGSWLNIFTAQLDSGLLDDAQKTLAAHFTDAGSRAGPLLRLSVAQDKAGQKPQAAKTRAQAIRDFHASGILERFPDSVAIALAEAGAWDEARQELQSLFQAKLTEKQIHMAAMQIMLRLCSDGKLGEALELASAWSALNGGDPEPLVTVYTQVMRRDGPQVLLEGE